MERYEEGQKFLPYKQRDANKKQGSAPYQGPVQRGNNPIVDLKVYEAQKPFKKKKKTVDPALFMPMATPGPFFPPQYTGRQPNVTAVKNYTINVQGISKPGQLSMIFEDILPKKEFSTTMSTVNERIDIHNFIRSCLVSHHDGQDMDITGFGSDSLLSYLRLLELNPYRTDKINFNPYKSLPDDLIIYSACYPQRYDSRDGFTQCARTSVGLNVRLYKMTLEDYTAKRMKDCDPKKLNLWREIMYFEYIRENMLKPKTCPNFVMLHSYFISEKADLDFDKIKKLKGKHVDKQTKYIPIEDGKACLDDGRVVTVDQLYQLNPKFYINKAMVALTEAPTYSLYGWASKTYQGMGNVKRMANTGYYNEEIWYSVLFQIMAALSAMQKKNVCINDFTMENNIYIKDVAKHENITKHWKYIIDGVTYYVPNHGFMALIDSNYKSLFDTPDSLIYIDDSNPKIVGGFLEDGDVTAQCYNMFKRAMDPNELKKSFLDAGGTSPPEPILEFMKIVHSDTSTTDISKLVAKHMSRFMHNRIGTLLTEGEVKKIRNDTNKEFHKGQMIVETTGNNEYKFGMFLERNGTNAKIMTRSDPSAMNEKNEIMEKSINIFSLNAVSLHSKIPQDFKNGFIFNEDKLLETYNIE